ncbi:MULTISPECIES: D-alanyl-D-alanine carboxypeptidase family protein [Thalassospira]|jgi:serine-type D-Ala-D-Ala carboxypeptidase (penicillin-binding protein 5/6)|uniref:D-alanyl-D-alanine carboxypeptidase family protein n=1 Tax=Thalassospira TaxID=168934 RepID=UPI001B1519BF|nr:MULTISPECIES: D-alanyl-D-alanine carboxypeptidase family protein [Thalassospira]MBO6807263.1 D-alanyl-D-alanine carboxypeptidase [Thalassospira sp.]MBO6841670.1 D-alanyl-D-alanine carboxypeptidase [Thalassospira sp.]
MTLMPPVPFKNTLNRVVAGAFILGSVMAMSMSSASAQAIETNAREAFIMDFDTGAVLLDKEGDTLTEPASMTKMMTVHMLFKYIKDGRVSMDDTFHVSEKAWRKGGSKMFVEVNSNVSVSDLLHGIIVQSGNDAAIVVAEGLGGSEEAFAEAMTEEARAIGMTKSVFKNATGWPAEGHLVTVRDLAILARDTIRNFPDLYELYSVKEFTYNGIRQPNRNPLLGTSAGVDGLKTGHTEAAGYGLTASAERDDRRLILVVNGLGSVRERRTESQKLLDWGFREFDNYDLFAEGETVSSANVWLGSEPKVDLVADKEVLLTLPRTASRDMKVSVVYEGPVPAPISQGDQIAMLKVEVPDQDTIEFPLYAAHDVGRLGFVGRIGAAIKYLLWGANG